MLILSMVFTIWRVIVRCRISVWMGLSDWLMILGAILNAGAIVLSIIGCWYGDGRLLADPYWTVSTLLVKKHMTFAGQLINVYAMFIVKLSICAYLLALNFSRTYRWVVWGTIAFVTTFNFILPASQHFGLCRPLAMRWDSSVKGQCWSQNVRISIAYTQAISNIVTDLIYATAPIAYIYSVKLSARTQWSVRIVFAMSLICTTISALKLWDFQLLQTSTEAFYDGVSLSIWSITEVSVGIVVGNVPPLRKHFDVWISRVLPSLGSKSSSRHTDSYGLPTYRTNGTRNTMNVEGMSGRGERLRSRTDPDNDSDMAILNELEEERLYHKGIIKTTLVEVDQETIRKEASRKSKAGSIQ
ncbi:hypothetical protein P280DRAFT_412298 [Massarina eburnea CBS 473.64]|uniref:Rhodopsin domain-containing protein n=1 Tax=Massarina eburnea CBS 473.64 TaxID=1395130 RepID=A0A6A6RJ28_9PLEO|nr:hypothetical protein P280DRAFT_412298 [Massarina eburnea CBS 473.64]